MSRFDHTRKGRIAVWTGAALAWGTAATLAGPKVVQADSTPDEVPAATTASEAVAAMPTLPEAGLVILRYQPSPTEKPDVHTVYVRPQAPSVTKAPSTSKAPATKSAPAPQSKGS